jgi:hypothetical protein
MAMVAAPYLHPKLNSIDVSGKAPFIDASGEGGEVSLKVSFVAPKTDGHAEHD